MRKIITISLLLVCYVGLSQNIGIGINPTGASPDPSAGLDIDFTDKGVLIPRLTTIQRDGIQNPAIGLQIYNTTTNCLQLFSPLSGWHDVVCDCQMPPTASAFTFTDSLSNNSNVVFTAITTGLNYSWTFQNGTPSTSNLQTETVVWTNPGTYAVTLTVTDNVGCIASTSDSVTIVACPPPLALNFTNCTQTGNTGPSQGQCNSAYTGTPLAGNITVVNGIQEWMVPFTGTYQIEVAGAEGETYSSYSGGKGAIVKGTVSLTQGDILRILVGQKSAQLTYRNAGGGGSFVVNGTSSTPVMIAGGGGGNGNTSNPITSIMNGSTKTNGSSGQGGGGVGGTNGNGGGAGNGSCCQGSGGGGYLTDGANGNGTGGKSFVNGGVGGLYSGNSSEFGGFGGGGAGGWWGGGGAGGYSGGGGGQTDNNAGGGGGSYIDATATNVSTSDGQYDNSSTFNGSSITNLNLFNSGDGYVNITLICP